VIWVLALFFGLGVGVLLLLQVAFGLFSSSEGIGRSLERRKQAVREKKEYVAGLSPDDREAFLTHEKRKRQYVKLRQRFAEEVQRRCYKEFAKDPPDIATVTGRRWKIEREVFDDMGLVEWNDINDAADCPEGMQPLRNVPLEFARFMKPDRVWTPPKWR